MSTSDTAPPATAGSAAAGTKDVPPHGTFVTGKWRLAPQGTTASPLPQLRKGMCPGQARAQCSSRLRPRPGPITSLPPAAWACFKRGAGPAKRPSPSNALEQASPKDHCVLTRPQGGRTGPAQASGRPQAGCPPPALTSRSPLFLQAISPSSRAATAAQQHLRGATPTHGPRLCRARHSTQRGNTGALVQATCDPSPAGEPLVKSGPALSRSEPGHPRGRTGPLPPRITPDKPGAG
ncbi:hypothetical protein NDU88_009021 [Pleurodeles waltl]|uniref:Uncharacterized protein n=1 Tax=Pleurodeles waltl TaxID=8319 RepID=A0AAV7QWE5_PLEWA|nr:hypothetical protein NDU88_009021 [Pleurodeles waltl]